MGSCSTKFVVNEHYPGQGPNVIVTAGKLRFHRSDLDVMYRQFCKMDADRSGTVSVQEFLTVNNVGSDLFGEMAFRVLDKNNSGKIDFLEYIIALWNFCTLQKDALSHFSFQIFDADSSGVLSMDEFKHMIDVVWGFKPNDHVMASLRKMDANGDGQITLHEFVSMVQHAPVLLFPAFEMQEKLRGNCLGTRQWMRITEERVQLYGHGTIFEIMDRCIEQEECLQKSIEIITT